MSLIMRVGVDTREALADICNERQISDAVEVGVDRGIFARAFLRRWRSGITLWLVDNWKAYAEMMWDREADRLLALMGIAIDGEAGRVRVLREDSANAAKIVNSTTPPGFVYIDAAHDYNSVSSDLRTWWPIVKCGGILAGHDWSTDGRPNEVQMAVTNFFNPLSLPIAITKEPLLPQSWYVYKPKKGSETDVEMKAVR